MLSAGWWEGIVREGLATGGLVGWNNNGSSISYCYAAGTVTAGGHVGGLVGITSGSVLNCFWDTETSGEPDGIGTDYGTGNTVTGKMTIEMYTESTFTSAGWDFVEIWNIGENQTYPYLRFYPAGDLNHDGVVNLLDLAILADHWLAGV